MAASDANLEYPFWHLKTCLSRISLRSCKTLQSRKFKSYVICSCSFVFFLLFISFFRLFICSYVFFLRQYLKKVKLIKNTLSKTQVSLSYLHFYLGPFAFIIAIICHIYHRLHRCIYKERETPCQFKKKQIGKIYKYEKIIIKKLF